MNSNFIIAIIIIVILITSAGLYLVYSNKHQENFEQIDQLTDKSNLQNLILPNKNTFDMRIPNEDNINTIVIDIPLLVNKIEIISKNEEANFPIDINSMNIIEPKIVYTEIKPDEAFKDNHYIRDKGLTDAMKKVGSNTSNEYKDLIGVVGEFKQPVSSNDKLSYKSYDEVKDKNMYIHEMYNEMSVKVNEDISKEEINRIIGKPIIREDLKDMYNPVYSNIDAKSIMLDIDYKYKGYDNIGMGSLL